MSDFRDFTLKLPCGCTQEVEVELTDWGEPRSYDYPGSGPSFSYILPDCCVKHKWAFSDEEMAALEKDLDTQIDEGIERWSPPEPEPEDYD